MTRNCTQESLISKQPGGALPPPGCFNVASDTTEGNKLSSPERAEQWENGGRYRLRPHVFKGRLSRLHFAKYPSPELLKAATGLRYTLQGFLSSRCPA